MDTCVVERWSPQQVTGLPLLHTYFLYLINLTILCYNYTGGSHVSDQLLVLVRVSRIDIHICII